MPNRPGWLCGVSSAVLGLSLVVAAPVAADAQTYGPELIDPALWPSVACPATAGTRTYMCLTAYPTYIGGTLPVPGPPSFRSLNLGTEVGSTYHVTYAIRGTGWIFGSAQLNAYWNGTLLSSTIPGFYGTSNTLTFAFDVLATAPATRLEFTNQLTGTCNSGICDDWGYITAVGDVSVRAVTSTPEPATFALVGGGLALVGVVVRRRPTPR